VFSYPVSDILRVIEVMSWVKVDLSYSVPGVDQIADFSIVAQYFLLAYRG
jgi:hypothetical protein